jgi:hypothetical protein
MAVNWEYETADLMGVYSAGPTVVGKVFERVSTLVAWKEQLWDAK